jgi:PhnB protein
MNAINVYLNFNGNCREAMTFYAECLGTKAEIMGFADAPGDHPAEFKDKVMHAKIGEGQKVIMASDFDPRQKWQPGTNFAVCMNCDSLEEIERLYAALSEKGNKTMPLQDTFWGTRFGMLTDQFGVNWMFNFDKPKQ